jgi:polyhydroxyalkanoate synthase
MTEKSENQTPIPDPLELAETMKDVAEKSQNILQAFLAEHSSVNSAASSLGHADPLNVGNAFLEMSRAMMANPEKLAEAQIDFWRQYSELWQKSAQQILGQAAPPSKTSKTEDRRFKDTEWETNPVFSFIKESYLLSSNWLLNTVHDVDGLDERTTRKIDFYTRQFIDAIAPTNFAGSNPEVLRATLETKGENLVSGFQNLLSDIDRGNGQLRIKMVDEDAFTIGENIATTPGKVVFQNELMQLIQYKPTTKTVHSRPLLIIPPWINKFYILDLRPKNSFIRWAVEQGHTVFVISWVNPDETLASKTMEDYMFDGPLAALNAIEQATGQQEINVIGYCLGGTLLAATLAYMTEKGDERIHAATYFTSMIDFAEAGELGVFVDEEQLGALEDRMNETGYLDGHEMAATFNMMRANDLIWSFVINNYLLGKEPLPFDLLYWNSDSTRMPAAMHSFYLRKMYLENKLIEPRGIEFEGIALDLTKIKTPTFVLSTREDHIAPWKSTYKAVDTYGGPVKFCLAASGHIAGVINPPESNKYAYWTNSNRPKSATDWFSNAKEHPGSWWPEWSKWIARHSGGKEPARQPGDGGLDAIENAPGSYVKSRA